jgi:tRNA (cmo5U34)-methyltransferase
MNVGDNLKSGNANWDFGGDTPKIFDTHVKKSIPMYSENQDLIVKLSDFFISNDSLCYDIGTSTGSLIYKLLQRHKQKNAKFIGIDNKQEMIDVATEKLSDIDRSRYELLTEDIRDFKLEKSDFITSYYTIQFIRPKFRQEIIDTIYKSLNWGGAFIFFEKVRAPDARFQDITTSICSDFKLDYGYNKQEILAKQMSLKGVLEPFTTNGNLDFLKRAGFKDIMTISKFVSFEGFLAIK